MLKEGFNSNPVSTGQIPSWCGNLKQRPLSINSPSGNSPAAVSLQSVRTYKFISTALSLFFFPLGRIFTVLNAKCVDFSHKQRMILTDRSLVGTATQRQLAVLSRL